MLKRIIGLHDREQMERTQKVTEYVDKKRTEYVKSMEITHQEAKEVHLISSKSKQNSGRIIRVANDVAAKVAVATGRLEFQ